MLSSVDDMGRVTVSSSSKTFLDILEEAKIGQRGLCERCHCVYRGSERAILDVSAEWLGVLLVCFASVSFGCS